MWNALLCLTERRKGERKQARKEIKAGQKEEKNGVPIHRPTFETVNGC